MSELTLILEKFNRGEPGAAERLLSLVYGELRQVAAARMAHEASGSTLQPTALVHEAWLRLGGDEQPTWQNRRHFFGAAAEAMRQILVERSRRRRAVRHGGGQTRVSADVLDFTPAGALDDRVVAVSEALDRLAARDPEKAELVKLRYFVGLTIDESAAALGISGPTAKRWWLFACAWLAREIHAQDNANA